MNTHFDTFLIILSIVRGVYELDAKDLSYVVDEVKHLDLTDINNSLLIDGFPVYFICRFAIFSKNFTIRFKRAQHFNNRFNVYSHLDANHSDRIYLQGDPMKIFDNEQNLFKTYESTLIEAVDLDFDSNHKSHKTYSVNCVLFLSSNSFSVLNKEFSADFDQFHSSWLKSRASQNLIHLFDMRLNIFERSTAANVYSEVLITINCDLTESKPKQYKAYMNHLKAFSTKKAKRSSPNKNAKNKLVVEACVHIDENIYNRVKNVLKITDAAYLRMFFSLQYAYKVFIIDKIYQTISDPDISIRVELVEIVFHNKYANIKKHLHSDDFSHSVEYYRQTGRFIDKYYAKNKPSDKCDHVFYMHGYVMGSTVGLADVGTICRQFDNVYMYMSLGLYLPYDEIVLAHELGHNLGAEHDDKKISQKFSCTYENDKVMHPFMQYSHLAHMFSECSIKMIKQNLLDRKMNLKAEFACLSRKSVMQNISFANNLYGYVRHKLPGYHFSLSDQCRMIYNDSQSYACGLQNECTYMKCVHGNKCIGGHVPLDGTTCQGNKICLFFKCVDPYLKEVANHSEIFPISLANSKYPNKFQSSARDLATKCPNGASQELKAIKNPYEDFNLLQAYGSCDKMLADKNIATDSSTCIGNHVANIVCCEKCIKYKLNECRNGKCKRITTCESLKQNPCFNDGKCITEKSIMESPTSGAAFTCKCPKGYYGNKNIIKKNEFMAKKLKVPV